MTSHQRILTPALPLFLRYGVQSMTMDDTAAHLGTSKKTVYK
ncbi:TetR/AcrR family transcriptional regulator [Hymenobacter canadensis]|uniref:TetR/AcrR family transcriptional regulator n=1 Tax=Hymenobacter canadensis TaxID=2999067 RepID=A0ABY7LVP4_9BACT|nr:TetR/AcrR family transcriptional regulator [Hymenobacter canadensis]WBA44141.1 TetR/AcrR family transcriptional regulator [Hymenobacter canadensis]